MAPCGYLSTDGDGYIVKVNKTVAECQLGYGREELTGVASASWIY